MEWSKYEVARWFQQERTRIAKCKHLATKQAFAEYRRLMHETPKD